MVKAGPRASKELGILRKGGRDLEVAGSLPFLAPADLPDRKSVV